MRNSTVAARKKTPETDTPSPPAKKPRTRKAAPTASAPGKGRTTRKKPAAVENGAGAPGSGKHLVIVESPAKAKTIQKYLGNNFMVKASFGHIRDLPKKVRR